MNSIINLGLISLRLGRTSMGWLLVLWLALGLSGAPLPQAPWLITLGTTWHTPGGEDWSYLFWQSMDSSSLSNRTIAVYRKDGEAAGPGVFSRQSIVRRQANPAIITPLLARSLNVGQDLALLSEQTDSLFQSVVPAPNLQLGEKLSAVIQGLTKDPSLAPRALLGARRHPGLALALGQAWAEPMPAGIDVVTYEVRDFNLANKSDLNVLARVTLRRGQPLVLPAPGIPVEVPTNGVQKHLLARLRWATPDPLRRLSPALNGYNLYRIQRDRATQLGFQSTAPGSGVLATLSLTDTTVQRVNRQPIFPGKEFNDADVGDFTLDPTTVFVSDFNHFEQGGPGFRDGDQYCYYVVGRDILGRDGEYSLSGCVTLCNQVPPLPPHHLKVVNDFVVTTAKGVQRLKVNFEPSPGAVTNSPLEYRVYRWKNRLDPQKGLVAPTLVSHLPHRGGTNKFSVLDAGPTAPSVEKDAGHVYWYTVRSAKATACGVIESADSAPAPGILRDRSGPDSPAPTLTVRRPEVKILARPISNEGGGQTNLPPGGVRYWLSFQRQTREISWIDVEMVDPSLPAGTMAPGRHYFPKYLNNTSLPHATESGFNSFEWGYVTTNKTGLKVRVSAGLANGITSPQQEFSLPNAVPVNSVGLTFDLSVLWTSGPAANGATHYPRALVPELAGPTTGIPIQVTPTADAHQWRIYRRLDAGRITMLAEGDVIGSAVAAGRNARPAALAPVHYTDDAMPINVAQTTYYTQFLDRDGNAGKLVASPTLFISSPPPAPTSLSLAAGNGTNDPATTMSLVWSAAPYGIARYRIYVGNPARQAVPLVASGLSGSLTHATRNRAAPAALAPNTSLSNEFIPFAIFRDFETDSGTTNLPCTVLDTTLIGGRIGVGPVYSNLLVRPTLEADLYVMIESVAADGTVGDVSHTLKLPAGAGIKSKLPLAAWPQRPLPPVTSTNWTVEGQLSTGRKFGVSAVRLKRGDPDGATDADFDGIGVNIAFFLNPQPKQDIKVVEGRNAFLNDELDPDSLLLQEAATTLPLFGQDNSFNSTSTTLPHFEVNSRLTLRPIRGLVMYRQQVASTKFPQPAGDVVQVTPLMKGIAHQHYPVGTPVLSSFPMPLPATKIIDPFIGLFKGKGASFYGLYLLDTQPIIQDATYQYFLVRFDEFGEMIDTIPTNLVTASLDE